MTIFITIWMLTGFIQWIKAFIEFYDHKIVRPGLGVLVLFFIAGPIPLLHALFE